ncbi:hypothetical protein NBRC116598_20970 [Pseudophaeobacter arcticus]|jgi:hypothetical protein|uniref:Uncharacterized protein n=1 Tax=Pseudophaeobacter arcticus TaxID=385492 RepID=A0ABQ0ALA1_9RHOB
MTSVHIPDEAKFVTGVQAIRSPRWPFGKDTFYKMVREGMIKKHHPYPGSRPVFSVAQIDKLYAPSSDN